jgi:hypothetical protein
MIGVSSPKIVEVAANIDANRQVGLVDFPEVHFVLPLGQQGPTDHGLWVGLRPEQFLEGGAVRFSPAMDLFENPGGVSYTFILVRGADAPLCVKLRGPQRPRPKQPETGFAPQAALYVDAVSGLRLHKWQTAA